MLIEPLPRRSELLRACRGIAYERHPILLAAYTLTVLHEKRLSADLSDINGIDAERSRHIRTIDRWVTGSLPPAHGSAHVHTETLGTVVDRVAQYTAIAYAALTSSRAYDLGNAWEQLAELAIGYEDLVAEVHTGRRRLPGGP